MEAKSFVVLREAGVAVPPADDSVEASLRAQSADRDTVPAPAPKPEA